MSPEKVGAQQRTRAAGEQCRYSRIGAGFPIARPGAGYKLPAGPSVPLALIRPLPRKIASCLGYMGRFVGSFQVPFAPRGTLCDFQALVRCRANGSPNFVWRTSYQQ